MQDICHRYCHYDDQQERHTKRHHPTPNAIRAAPHFKTKIGRKKIPFLSLPAFFVTSGCLVDKAAICNERSHVSPNVLVLSPSPVRVEVLALAKPGRCAFEQSLLQFV